MNIAAEISAETSVGCGSAGLSPEPYVAPWKEVGYSPFSEITEGKDLVGGLASCLELPVWVDWPIKVARGFGEDDMKSLEGNSEDPVPVGHRFVPNPVVLDDGLSFSLVAYGGSEGNIPVGYLSARTRIFEQDMFTELSDEELDDLGEETDLNTDEGCRRAEKEFGRRRWSLEVDVDYLFVDRRVRYAQCANSLIEMYVAMIYHEIYRLNELMEAHSEDQVELRVGVVAEPYGDGGHNAALSFLRALSELFGADPESSFFDELPEIGSIREVEELAEGLSDGEQAVLKLILEKLRKKYDPSSDGGILKSVSVQLRDHIDWE